jgi:hypothetical protein
MMGDSTFRLRGSMVVPADWLLVGHAIAEPVPDPAALDAARKRYGELTDGFMSGRFPLPDIRREHAAILSSDVMRAAAGVAEALGAALYNGHPALVRDGQLALVRLRVEKQRVTPELVERSWCGSREGQTELRGRQVWGRDEDLLEGMVYIIHRDAFRSWCAAVRHPELDQSKPMSSDASTAASGDPADKLLEAEASSPPAPPVEEQADGEGAKLPPDLGRVTEWLRAFPAVIKKGSGRESYNQWESRRLKTAKEKFGPQGLRITQPLLRKLAKCI